MTNLNYLYVIFYIRYIDCNWYFDRLFYYIHNIMIPHVHIVSMDATNRSILWYMYVLKGYNIKMICKCICVIWQDVREGFFIVTECCPGAPVCFWCYSSHHGPVSSRLHARKSSWHHSHWQIKSQEKKLPNTASIWSWQW